MSKELLTASRMNCLLSCPRKHYYRYEVGLRRSVDGDALRFGSAWHVAMEARWQGLAIGDAFNRAIGDRIELDELQVATLSGLLAAYYTHHFHDPIQSVHPEVEFRHALGGSRTFDCAGKIDGLAVMKDGRLALVEHKTAGYDISPESDYWLRLRGNTQVMQYILAARSLGWDVSLVIYDVTRKPMIAPRATPVLDENGCKIVKDRDGNRIFKKDSSPRESSDLEKGWMVQTEIETPEQFGDRLAQDAKDRPDFYFARREVPILEDDLAEFEIQRGVLARSILSCRAESRRASKPEHGWPRNVGEMTCKYCDYCGFCLQNMILIPEQPPSGFVVGQAHTELTV